MDYTFDTVYRGVKMIRINAQRFQRNFEELARIGATADGGVNRPALSEAHLAARRWFKERIEGHNLSLKIDAAGNHSAVLHCGVAGAKTLILGSHLDSVPGGGRYDGALGVLAALEVLQTVQDAGLKLPVNLEAIDFTDEEGTLVGLLGSRALAGRLESSDLENPRGGRSQLLDGFARAGITDPLAAARRPDTVAGFLEIHIEQGDRLTEAGCDIGIVTGIVGIGSYEMTFHGRADHAGTTGMLKRKDAGLGAAAYMLVARNRVIADFPNCVVNFGHATFEPGAYNIVPERVKLHMEYRAPGKAEMKELEAALISMARHTAQEYGLELSFEPAGCLDPVQCAPLVQAAFKSAVRDLGLKSLQIASGAGHDTQSMAGICPSGMIFIPSYNGSHNPREFAEWEACVKGANTLLTAALKLAG
jgi:N-carbamoyl-L-amino-acid hydrolase